MANLLWLQGGACSGNTMSFLNAEEPSACDLVTDFGINVLWHPSLGMELGENLQKMLRALVSGQMPLDIFVFEGTVVQAPNGTGEWNRFAGRAMKDWVRDLAKVATFTVAVGDCATWGGIPATAPNPSDSVGLQFLKRGHGGFLGKDYKSKAGLPVINIPGCPAHPDWITQIVVAVATGRGGDLTLDDFGRPKTFFQSFTQTGCTRNMHFAYKVSATEFGQRKGCLFYDLGCRGPMTHSPCNRILWNRQSSKTRAGMPCMGCTEPEFPFYDLAPGTVFKTQTVMGVPKDMPTGVDKTGYVKLTAAAKAASPKWEAALARLTPECSAMRFMDVRALEILGADCVVTRSGYTGEDGFEISLPPDRAADIATALLKDPDVAPIGLGARDSLRLEASLCLYGSDLDETTTPVEANLVWAIQAARRGNGEREGGFPGAEIILKQLANGASRCRVGFLPDGIGTKLQKGAAAAVVESVKTASDVYAPLSGEVVETNDAITKEPALVNSDPLGKGWLYKIRLEIVSDFDGLMDEDAYKKLIG